MPTLDTIRTIEIRGKTDGVDQATASLKQMTDAIKAANDNLVKSNAAASAGSDGFNITGLSAASAANHLRQAAEAAYTFSPAFRGVVNELAVPALKTAGTALEAVAGGIVTATNVAGTGVTRLGTAVETAFPAFTVLSDGIKTAGSAMEAFAPTVGGVTGSILGMAGTIVSRFLPVVGQILLVYDAIKLVGQAWELGNAKLAEYVALSEKASAAGLSTNFFQRISKASEEAKAPVEDLLKSIAKINDAMAPKLGNINGDGVTIAAAPDSAVSMN